MEQTYLAEEMMLCVLEYQPGEEEAVNDFVSNKDGFIVKRVRLSENLTQVLAILNVDWAGEDIANFDAEEELPKMCTDVHREMCYLCGVEVLPSGWQMCARCGRIACITPCSCGSVCAACVT